MIVDILIERNQQGIGNMLIFPDPNQTQGSVTIGRRHRLAGMLDASSLETLPLLARPLNIGQHSNCTRK
jgi:hypothetical protein